MRKDHEAKTLVEIRDFKEFSKDSVIFPVEYFGWSGLIIAHVPFSNARCCLRMLNLGWPTTRGFKDQLVRFFLNFGT